MGVASLSPNSPHVWKCRFNIHIFIITKKILRLADRSTDTKESIEEEKNHVSSVTCHVSPVPCHWSKYTCHMSPGHISTSLFSFSCYKGPRVFGDAIARRLVIDKVQKRKKRKKKKNISEYFFVNKWKNLFNQKSPFLSYKSYNEGTTNDNRQHCNLHQPRTDTVKKKLNSL